MAVYYKSIEVHGNQFGSGLEVYKSRKGREILVPGYGVLRISPKEMKYARIEEVPRVEMKRMAESAVILYLERLGILYEGYEDRAERLLREWERLGSTHRYLSEESAAMRLQEYFKGTGYEDVQMCMVGDSRATAMMGIRIVKKFKFTEHTRRFVMKSKLMGEDLGDMSHRFRKEIKRGLDPREILLFKGDVEKEYMVEGRPMREVEELVYISEEVGVVEYMHIKRPLMFTEAGIQIYMEYLRENFSYARV